MRGFIALTSVLILSAVLLALTIGAAGSDVNERFDGLEREYKAESAALARSCLAEARLSRLADPGYPGGEALRLPGGSCAIGAVSDRFGVTALIASASYRSATTALLASISDESGSVISVREIPSPP